jgi:hypothetical protein
MMGRPVASIRPQDIEIRANIDCLVEINPVPSKPHRDRRIPQVQFIIAVESCDTPRSQGVIIPEERSRIHQGHIKSQPERTGSKHNPATCIDRQRAVHVPDVGLSDRPVPDEQTRRPARFLAVEGNVALQEHAPAGRGQRDRPADDQGTGHRIAGTVDLEVELPLRYRIRRRSSVPETGDLECVHREISRHPGTTHFLR